MNWLEQLEARAREADAEARARAARRAEYDACAERIWSAEKRVRRFHAEVSARVRSGKLGVWRVSFECRGGIRLDVHSNGHVEAVRPDNDAKMAALGLLRYDDMGIALENATRFDAYLDELGFTD